MFDKTCDDFSEMVGRNAISPRKNSKIALKSLLDQRFTPMGPLWFLFGSSLGPRNPGRQRGGTGVAKGKHR